MIKTYFDILIGKIIIKIEILMQRKQDVGVVFKFLSVY